MSINFLFVKGTINNQKKKKTIVYIFQVCNYKILKFTEDYF